jgi:hypothetical protein
MKGPALNAQAAALYPSAKPFTIKEAAMDTAATCNVEHTLERVLYMAIELADNHRKLGFTTGFGQRPRERNVAAIETEELEREI